MKSFNTLTEMYPYYKKIENMPYDPQILVDRFNKLYSVGKYTSDEYFVHAEKESCLDIAMDMHVYKLHPKNPVPLNQFGLSKFINEINFHTTPGNNGVIFFLAEGSFTIDFYNYIPPDNSLDRLGRGNSIHPSQITEELEKEISSTLVESVSVEIGIPIITNGRMVHRFRFDDNPIFFGIKIPHLISFNEVRNEFNI